MLTIGRHRLIRDLKALPAPRSELQGRLEAVLSTRDRVHARLEAVVSVGSDVREEVVRQPLPHRGARRRWR
ncbi:hypothetical protein [Streptosporangium sp. H16]|uniref:hypothetical protein n=1 Tax=Streptosporangium sp. H16 TaxID=3444184 RepID=UPI003F7A2652